MREMKNSGIEWIGEIPKNWNNHKLLYALNGQITDGPHETPVSVDGGIPFISVDSLNDSENVDLTIASKFISQEDFDLYNKKAKLEKGDVLFSKAATIGKTAIVGDEKFMVWSPLAILKPNYDRITTKYLYYLVNCDSLIKYVSLLGGFTTQINVGMKAFEKAIIPMPSIEEQKTIADFLDEKCADVDEIISAKEKTNELLKERRQSIITEAVTKGLNPNAEMKDSGIDWIGEISFSKNVVRLKHYLENQMQYGANESGTSDANGNIRYIRITDINNDSSLKDNEDNKYLTIEQAESYILKDGDVLFARSGATVGKSFIYKESYGKCAFAGYLIKAECNRTKLLPKYLFYYTSTSTYESWKNMIFIQATIQNIGADKYQEMPLIMTSIEEQKEIVDYLDKKCEEIDKLIESNNKTIEKLQEYRKSLIYEAVTGKIEV